MAPGSSSPEGGGPLLAACACRKLARSTYLKNKTKKHTYVYICLCLHDVSQVEERLRGIRIRIHNTMIISPVFLLVGVAGTLLSTLLPLNPGIKARVYIVPNSTTVATHLLCDIDCDDVCNRSKDPPGGIPLCGAMNDSATQVLCVKYEPTCCTSITEYCYGGNGKVYPCGEICLDHYDKQTCTATCNHHWIMEGLIIPRYPWLMIIGDSKQFPLRVDCGPVDVPPLCVFPHFYHLDGVYYLTLECFVLLLCSVASLVVGIYGCSPWDWQ